ncbi:hypothetical protein QFC22_003573 [Naganishia vaughanmartiniae]|uniref:Uncharacterized protein n=1 Tax=Naganishia vaughanmartiniae TaxID=1424756 RepID=A0ACC2X740_9TREE|nr:hypothetical protein QFC22_003573 [Naganishia vaughanmartiniae]
MAAVQSKAGPSAPVTDLRKSIEAHDETFTKLLSLIPAQYYIVDTPEEADTKWMRNKKKRSADEMTETRKKAKFDKFDPSNNKTIPEIQAERAARTQPQDEDDEGVMANKPITPMAPASSVTDLRKKLQDKIDSFRKRRREAPLHPESSQAASGDAEGKEEDGNGTDDDGMTAASRDEMLEERRKRRGEVRDNRRNRRKEERRAEKEGKPVKKQDNKGDKTGEKKATDFTTKAGKTQLIVDPLAKSAAPTKRNVPSVPEDNVSFAAIALPSTSKSTSSHLKNISNPTQALQHLQNQKAKLAELPEEKRKQIEEKEKWAKAQERAEGGKVRDNENQLKKAAKRVDKQKSKSSKEWSDRKEEIQNSQAVKAKKRNENITSRIDARKNKKLGLKPKGDKEKKKGGGRPGFEGGRKKK